MRNGTTKRRAAMVLVIAAVIVAAWPAKVFAATQPRLGTALNFTVLAGSAITNTGPTVITGNLGLDPGTASSVTGFPPGSVTGVKHTADAVALQAKNDLVTAYTDAATAPTTSNLTGKNLGGKNLTPGVYTFSSSAQLTGSLTLSGNGVFIFRIGTPSPPRATRWFCSGMAPRPARCTGRSAARPRSDRAPSFKAT